MNSSKFDIDVDIAWCPGCGDFQILKSVKQVLEDIQISQEQICLVSGIGQAAKLPQYLKVNYFNGLHGRALPVATAIRLANPELTVIVHAGDGDCYGEGGNHFIHTIRKNPDVTLIVHNNMVYGLTKGQGSPTSQIGFKNPIQTEGVYIQPFNAISTAISLDISFVARAFSGDVDKTKEIIKQAIENKGFSLVEILHPCTSFNKINTFQWFKKHSSYLEDSYDPEDKLEAFLKANNTEMFHLGIIYRNPKRRIIEESIGIYDENKEPLYRRKLNLTKLQKILEK